MTVFPGSMDHLYYGGVIPCIPYEAYERPSYNVAPYQHGMGMADPETAWTINEIHRIKNEGKCDTFNYATEMDNKSYRESILDAAKDDKSIRMDKPNKSMLVKGLIGAGVLITTLALLIRGKKAPASTSTNTSFWSKLNPLNWFK